MAIPEDIKSIRSEGFRSLLKKETKAAKGYSFKKPANKMRALEMIAWYFFLTSHIVNAQITKIIKSGCPRSTASIIGGEQRSIE